MLLMNQACAENMHSNRNNNTVKGFIQKLLIIESKTSAIDNLSSREQTALINEARSLRELSTNLPTSSGNNTDLSVCVDASEALINFIQASVKINRYARQDWEDYKINRNNCLASIKQ